MKRIVSGVQPTGHLHIGNYLGSIKNWVPLQEEYKCFFPIVDLHAITGEYQDPQKFYNNILTTAASYIACGLDPNKVSIFQQSDIPCHSELHWIFSCSTQIGKLNRMTQFKDKSKGHQERASLGLYSYPVLMAADILLYKAHLVPIGEDQTQHLELTNEILTSFNSKYKTDYFSKVEPVMIGNSKRIMSLRNGTKKMSKSDESDMTRINLTDSNDEIKLKIKKAKTDNIPDLLSNINERPEINNLLKIYSAFSGEEIKQIIQQYSASNFSNFKNSLSDLIISVIEPIATKTKDLLNDKTYLQSTLQNGAARANNIAEKHLLEIKKIIGLSK